MPVKRRHPRGHSRRLGRQVLGDLVSGTGSHPAQRMGTRAQLRPSLEDSQSRMEVVERRVKPGFSLGEIVEMKEDPRGSGSPRRCKYRPKQNMPKDPCLDFLPDDQRGLYDGGHELQPDQALLSKWNQAPTYRVVYDCSLKHHGKSGSCSPPRPARRRSITARIGRTSSLKLAASSIVHAECSVYPINSIVSILLLWSRRFP